MNSGENLLIFGYICSFCVKHFLRKRTLEVLFTYQHYLIHKQKNYQSKFKKLYITTYQTPT